MPRCRGLFITHKNDVGPTIPSLFDELGNFRFPTRELARSAGENVLLLEIASFNVRAGAEVAATPILAAHGVSALSHGRAVWELRGADGEIVCHGDLDAIGGHIARPDLVRLGEVRFTAPLTEGAETFKLAVGFSDETITVENEWNIYVYAADLASGRGLCVYDPGDTLNLRRYYPDAEFMASSEPRPDTKAVVATAVTPGIQTYVKAGGTLIYAGGGSESLPVSRVYNWNAYSMPFIPDPSHPALGGVGRRGFGCLDFLELFTEDAISAGHAGARHNPTESSSVRIKRRRISRKSGWGRAG